MINIHLMKSLGKIGDVIVVVLAATYIPKLAVELANKVYPFVSSELAPNEAEWTSL